MFTYRRLARLLLVTLTIVLYKLSVRYVPGPLRTGGRATGQTDHVTATTTTDQPPDKRAHERRQFLRNNVLATGSTFAAGLLGFVLQAATSHVLRPDQYGKAFAVLSFFALITRPAAAFGRLVAWQTSRDLAHTHDLPGDNHDLSERSGVLRQATIRLLIVGAIVGAICILGGSVLATYLHVPLRYIVVGGLSTPFLLATQPLLGSLQGEQRFVPWSALSLFLNLSRLIFVVGLILPLGAYGAVMGTTIAAVVTFTVCLAAVWPVFSKCKAAFDWRPARPLVITGFASTLAFGVFQGADVIIVEHFVSKVQGGQYAVVSVVGNAVFFATGGVASVVFPIIASRHARDRSTFGIMGGSLGLCAAAGLIGTIGLQVFGHFILLNFAGKRYVAGSHYLGLYALGMALLGCVVVLVNTEQSRNTYGLLWLLIPITILLPTLLVFFHHTLMTVVVIRDVTIAAFLLISGAMYVVAERKRLRAVGSGRATSETRLAALPAGASVPMA